MYAFGFLRHERRSSIGAVQEVSEDAGPTAHDLSYFQVMGPNFPCVRGIVGFPVNFLLCSLLLHDWRSFPCWFLRPANKSMNNSLTEQRIPGAQYSPWTSCGPAPRFWVHHGVEANGPTLSFRRHAHSAIVVPNLLITAPPGTLLALTTWEGGTPGLGCCDPPGHAQDSGNEDCVAQHATVA